MNLELKPNQKIAIVGRNGVGKTTLTKLLLRLYDVDEGNVYINQNIISDISLSELRSSIGVAFQETHVYAESIRDNINIYQPKEFKLEDSELKQVMQDLNLTNILNLSLDTEMTKEFKEEGIELSGGQKQLLMLSRLFTKKFNLLILDEPSSSLDPLMEYQLNKLIIEKFKDTSVIIIAHRLSTTKDADCIYLLDDGKVAEFGTHEYLMDKKGIYWDLFTKQAEGYIE